MPGRGPRRRQDKFIHSRSRLLMRAVAVEVSILRGVFRMRECVIIDGVRTANAGPMAGSDPTLMGISPVPACRKLFKRTGLNVRHIDLKNQRGVRQPEPRLPVGAEHRAECTFRPGERLARCTRPGAFPGRVRGQGRRALNSIMKTDFPDAVYGVAMLCGGFGNGNAVLLQKVNG